jgi:hypothetical protein
LQVTNLLIWDWLILNFLFAQFGHPFLFLNFSIKTSYEIQ